MSSSGEGEQQDAGGSPAAVRAPPPTAPAPSGRQAASPASTVGGGVELERWGRTAGCVAVRAPPPTAPAPSGPQAASTASAVGGDVELERWGRVAGCAWLRRARATGCGWSEWGTEKVNELIHCASTSQTSEEWPNRPFLGNHPNPSNLACGSLANGPSRHPNKPNLYYISLAKP